MTIQERIEQMQKHINNTGGLGAADAQFLIHQFNVRGAILADIHKTVVHHRRLWRKTPISGDKMGYLLTFVRQLAYRAVKMRGQTVQEQDNEGI